MHATGGVHGMCGFYAARKALRRIEATHAMHATGGRRGGRAEVQTPIRCRVEPRCWPDEELPQVGDSAVDVAADVVGIVALDVGRRHDVTGEDARGEARGESLDLRLDSLAHVDRRSIRHMAIGPTDVLARR